MALLRCSMRIEKCSSPIGDGNKEPCEQVDVEFSIEKCSSPIGDGNFMDYKKEIIELIESIEKCSSPIGDGNSYKRTQSAERK